MMNWWKKNKKKLLSTSSEPNIRKQCRQPATDVYTQNYTRFGFRSEESSSDATLKSSLNLSAMKIYFIAMFKQCLSIVALNLNCKNAFKLNVVARKWLQNVIVLSPNLQVNSATQRTVYGNVCIMQDHWESVNSRSVRTRFVNINAIFSVSSFPQFPNFVCEKNRILGNIFF